MSHVFISYSSRHRDLTRTLAERLVAAGYPVWWDHALEAWGPFRTQIEAALQESGAVVVIWSAGAKKSDWVIAEAEKAREHYKLVNLRAPDFPHSEMPAPFNRIDHVHLLDDDLDPILRSIETVWRGIVPTGVQPRHATYRGQYGVALFSQKLEPPPTDLADLAPSALLQARYAIVPYVDEAGFLADTLDWCRGTGRYAQEPRATAGRLVHGPGGLGKTRAMIETVRQLRDEGWLAGFTDPPKRPSDVAEMADREAAIAQVMADGPEPGVLMVLDYAEARRPEILELARLARSRPREGVFPLRVVLLSRGDSWWQDFYRQEATVEILFQRRGHAFGDVLAASPAPQGAARLSILDATLDAYRPIMTRIAEAGLGAPPAAGAVDPARRVRIANDDAFARPLALQMEALVHLVGRGSEAGGLERLLGDVVGLERRHWARVIHGLASDEPREEALRRGLAQVTAVGGTARRRETEDLLAADPHFGTRAPAALPWRDLHRLYASPGRDGGITPLEPDLVGEHATALAGDERLVEGCLAWIDGLPEIDRTPRRRVLVTVLQRATRAEHGSIAVDAERMLAHLVARVRAEAMPDVLAVAVETPGRLAVVLEAMVPVLDEDVLAAAETVLPQQTVTLAAVADAVAARREREALAADQTTPSNQRRAALGKIMHQRGKTLSALGRRQEALAVTQKSVLIYRALWLKQPEHFAKELSASLNNLGVCFGNIGMWSEALQATEEAITLRRQLALADPATFESDLAASLNNLGYWLSSLNRQDEALAATQEAVSIYETLSIANPEKYASDLARSKDNIGVDYANLGRFEEALDSTMEAAKIRRRLADDRPDEYEPSFAPTLVNLGNCLFHLGRPLQAVIVTQEAVDIFYRLSEFRPDTFEPDLARSLGALSEFLVGVGRDKEAKAAASAAISRLSRHYELYPSAHHQVMAELLAVLAKARARGADDVGDDTA